jgi:hypothetical protein
VHEDAGRVEHRAQAAGRRRQGGQDGGDGVGGGQRAGADALLDVLDGGLDQVAAQPVGGGGELRIGQQRVGAGHAPPRVGACRLGAHRRRA